MVFLIDSEPHHMRCLGLFVTLIMEYRPNMHMHKCIHTIKLQSVAIKMHT